MTDVAEITRPQNPDQYEKKRILELLDLIRKSPLVASVSVIFSEDLETMHKIMCGGDH